MRLWRIAGPAALVALPIGAQSPIVRGDSVRVSFAASDVRVGRVAHVTRDTLQLDDGTTWRVSSLRQIEVQRLGEVNRGSQITFGIAGGLAGLVAGRMLSDAICDCGLVDAPGMAGGALLGLALARRTREMRWLVAWTPADTLVAERRGVRGPAIQPPAFATTRVGDYLRVWSDTGRRDGQFLRVDGELLHLQNAPAAIPLSSIDVVERRVDHTGAYAFAGAAIIGLATVGLYGIGCSLGDDCNDYGPVIVVSAGSGALIGALVGAAAKTWKPFFTR